jgi:very-short-patch-repair endonuclease
MTVNPEGLRHKEWLGLLQPVGLVVSPPALIKAQAFVDRAQVIALQEQLLAVCETPSAKESDSDGLYIPDFLKFAELVLGWLPEDVSSYPERETLSDGLEVVLPDYGETLKPTYAVHDANSERWLLLVQEIQVGQSLDEVGSEVEKGQGWKVSVQEKFERLLRETGVSVGVLCNGVSVRLVYAPKGESSGHLTFPVQAMGEVPGRLILGALEMLLGANRLFNVPVDRRLPKLLSDSREAQAEVSNQLADQVLDALWELLRGFQTADAVVNGQLLWELAATHPEHIYGGLITTLMRLVFLLYAEDQGLMPGDAIYQRNYAVAGLYERLREDAGNYPDTLDQRYGAWAWLLSLFRLVYDGGGTTPEYLPARHGQLFNPDEYPFLEGRDYFGVLADAESIEVPRVPDGVIYRMLDKLLVLDGERLSYRALDVEQIGSVYEAIMGFEVKIAQGYSIAVKPKDVVIDIEALLKIPSNDRAKKLKDWTELKIEGKVLAAVKEARTPEDCVAALGQRVSVRTKNILPPDSLYFQPGEERRRTGSHYTPRKLTQPIVETTLRPVLAGLGEHPTAAQILDLRVCDPAMGSGAFLVEACRQLAEKLVEAWNREEDLSRGIGNHPHPPTPSPIEGEGEQESGGVEVERWEISDALREKMQEVARQFRKEPTVSEKILWQALRGRKLDGWKFRRQQPIGTFVVDFFCASERLIVEVDGLIHETQHELDQQRQELLESLGLRFVRVSSEQIETDLTAILAKIRTAFSPLSPGGRGVGGEGDSTEPLLVARRLVAQRCLYGVDKNPFAVNLAKLSLWLVTLAKDRPFTFVDHALKCGDSLVGLTRSEIGSFGKDPLADLPLMQMLKEKMDRAKAYRAEIQSIDTNSDEEAKNKLARLGDAERELKEARLTADISIASFFDGVGKSKRDRQELREEYERWVGEWRRTSTQPEAFAAIQERLRGSEHPVLPFSWEVEFPEVFDRENSGFDAIVGNPPFLGGSRISSNYGDEYLKWILEQHPESHGNGDLVAHFFRRSFTLLRKGGCLGLIATNTIAQGDTRSTGLRFICNNGGIIYNATRRYKWPGLAAVVVSLVHIMKTKEEK